MALRLISLFVFLLISTPVWSATKYVRTDGGTGTQCDGSVDAPQAGAVDGADSNTTPDCALNHPAWALPPRDQSTTWAIAAGDILVIGSGSYRTGCQNATTCADSTINYVRNGWCNEFQSYDCYLGVIPNNATVIGCSATGCPTPSQRPVIWGAGRVNRILDASNSSGVTIQDIDITDHESCMIANNQGKDCGSGNQPTRLSGLHGILAHGAVSLTLDGVNIHGMGANGLFAASTTNISLIDSNFNYNYIGWESDTTNGCTTCGHSGTITITGSTFNHNSCIEDWQNPGTIITEGCFSQSQGAFGDGIGMPNTGGDWVITDSDFSYNIADGLDLLYHNRGIYSGGTITIRRSRGEGNGGNPFKTSNALYVEDTAGIANCGYFYGQPFRENGPPAFDNDCRGAGAAFAFEFHAGDTTIPKFYNVTAAGNGDTMFMSSGVCPNGQNVQVKNSIIVGGADFIEDNTIPGESGGRDDKVNPFYDAGTDGNGTNCNTTFVVSHNICVGDFVATSETSPCSGTGSTTIASYSGLNAVGPITQGPYNTNGYRTSKNYIDAFYLTATSPAVGISDTTLVGADAVDNNNFARGSSWDAGALELDSIDTDDVCGDGVRGSDEDCEGADLAGYVCTTVPGGTFTGGTLACTGGCAFDTSACTGSSVPVCGNSSIESGETCDDGNVTNGDCCSSTCQTEVSGVENFSDESRYTETDSQGYIDISTYTATVTDLDRNSNTTLVYDGGASHFGNFTATFRFDWTSCDATDGTCFFGFMGFFSSTHPSLADLDTSPDGVFLSLYKASAADGGQLEWALENSVDDTGDFFAETDVAKTYYISLSRVGTTLTASFYDNPNFSGTPEHVLTTIIPSTSYKYFYPIMSYNDGNTDAEANFTIQDVNIGESVLSCGGSTPTGGSGNVISTRCGMTGRFQIP